MSTSSKTVLILNGKSAANEQVRQAVYSLRAEGHEIEVRVTWESGDTPRYLEEAIRLQADTVVAGGGDGTINQLLNGIMQLAPEKRPTLGILPLGTANDFARSAGIPELPEPALRLAINGQTAAADVVCVNQDRHFINMATGGFGTKITTETPDKLKAALGGMSYVLHGLLRMDTLQPDHCEIISDGFRWQGDALVIGIGNGRQAGGGQRLCPTAFIDDGLMDISIVTAEQWFPTIVHNLTGSEDNPGITTARCHTLEIKARHKMTFNLDGEPLSGEYFRMTLQPKAIHCRMPDNSPLLKETLRTITG